MCSREIAEPRAIASLRLGAMKPRVEYVPVDRVGASAAYSVSGAGPRAVFVSNWISHLDAALDADPRQPFLQGLESFCTMLLIDQLGAGQSDTFSSEQLADRAV